MRREKQGEIICCFIGIILFLLVFLPLKRSPVVAQRRRKNCWTEQICWAVDQKLFWLQPQLEEKKRSGNWIEICRALRFPSWLVSRYINQPTVALYLAKGSSHPRLLLFLVGDRLEEWVKKNTLYVALVSLLLYLVSRSVVSNFPILKPAAAAADVKTY